MDSFRTKCIRELKKVKRAWPDLHYYTVTGRSCSRRRRRVLRRRNCASWSSLFGRAIDRGRFETSRCLFVSYRGGGVWWLSNGADTGTHSGADIGTYTAAAANSDADRAQCCWHLQRSFLLFLLR